MTASRPRATLATVAASVGVSVATVSKVLNRRSDVSPTTRARVQDVLREHDYVSRRDPAEKTTGELCLSGMSTYAMEVIQGVLDEARATDVDIVISTRPPGAPRADGGSCDPVDPGGHLRGTTRDHRRQHAVDAG